MSCGRERGLGPVSDGDLEGESIERLSGEATRSHSARDLRREATLRRVTTLLIAADTGRGTGTYSAQACTNRRQRVTSPVGEHAATVVQSSKAPWVVRVRVVVGSG